tara:strand:+ start:472 stop:945 length:474 start_codon:yes stop_codon:yes gene_type:complete
MRECISNLLILYIIYCIVSKAVEMYLSYVSADNVLKKDYWFYPKEGRRSFDAFYKHSNDCPFEKDVKKNPILMYKDTKAFTNPSFGYRYDSRMVSNGADYVGATGNIYKQHDIPDFTSEVLSQNEILQENKKNYDTVDVIPDISFLDIDAFLEKYQK